MYQLDKTLSLCLCLLWLVGAPALAQSSKPDTRTALQKEDGLDRYHANDITTLDLLQALDFMGIRIQKFALGRFDRTYRLLVLAETYVKGAVVKTDTLLAENNQYHYYEPGKEDYFLDYIDQLKVITKTEDNRSEVQIHTYAMSTRKEVALDKWDDQQFYNWRFFTDTRWKLNKKVPLMTFASSWQDKQYDFHRFCGVVHLAEGEAETEELLRESPTYVLFSYQVSPLE